MNCCPRFSWSFAAAMRVKKSSPPPGGKVTMIRTGFAGHDCAMEVVGAITASRASAIKSFAGILMKPGGQPWGR